MIEKFHEIFESYQINNEKLLTCIKILKKKN